MRVSSAAAACCGVALLASAVQPGASQTVAPAPPIAPPAPPRPMGPPLPVVAAPAADEPLSVKVHTLRGIDVPLVLARPSFEQKSANLWAKGDRPVETLLASADARPIATATVELPGAGATPARTLTLAKAEWRDLGDPKPALPMRGAIYCGSDFLLLGDTRSYCLIDVDEDGRFDELSLAMTEAPGAPVHAAGAISAPTKLITPLAYRKDAGDAAPLRIEWRNCDKDWDRPRYTMALERPPKGAGADAQAIQTLLRSGAPLTPEVQQALRALSAQSGGSPGDCQRGDPQPGYAGARPDGFGKGSAVVGLGPLLFAIAAKEDVTPVRLIAMRDEEAHYRLEGRALVALSKGYSPLHIDVATIQRFDREVLEATGEIKVAGTPAKAGQELFRLGFSHGYAGALTQDVKIRTLLSSRSLPAGTVLYGFPAKSSLTMTTTYGGSPISSRTIEPENQRAVNTSLVWCVPVRDEEPADAKPGSAALRIRWSATCLPGSLQGTHTILKGQAPAFSVTSLGYDAGTSSNPGPPPVRPIAAANFGAPLSQRFTVDTNAKERLLIRQETLLGDEVVDTGFVEAQWGANGRILIPLAGGMVSLVRAEDGVAAKLETPVRKGASAALRTSPWGGPLRPVTPQMAEKARAAQK